MNTYSDGNGGQVDTYGNPISYGENSYYDSVNQRPIKTITTVSYGADTSGYGMHSSGTGSGAITPGGGGYGMNSSGTGSGGIYGGGTYHDPYTTGPGVSHHQQQSHIPSYTSPAGDYDGGVVHSTTTTTNDYGEKVQIHHYRRGEKKCCVIC